MKLRGGLLGVKRGKDVRYPLSEALSSLFPPPPISKPGQTRKKTKAELSGIYSNKRDARLEVVSEELCGMYNLVRPL